MEGVDVELDTCRKKIVKICDSRIPLRDLEEAKSLIDLRLNLPTDMVYKLWEVKHAWQAIMAFCDELIKEKAEQEEVEN